MRIAEIFTSIQGEGRFAGTRSVFVRTTGCNLRCHFCDTPYASWAPEGEQRSIPSLMQDIAARGVEHVVLTGGEPFLQPGIVDLSWRLQQAGHYVTVETAATVDRPVAADLLSISPKRSNSDPAPGDRWRERHQRRQHQPEVIRRFTSDYDYQLKFVVDTPEDLMEIDLYLLEFPHIRPSSVWLMPQGVRSGILREKQKWLEPAAVARGYQFCPRKHIELFGNIRGT